MDDNALRDLKKAIEEGYRGFTRSNGKTTEGFSTPLQNFLTAPSASC